MLNFISHLVKSTKAKKNTKLKQYQWGKVVYQSAVNLTEYHTAKYADNLRREIYRENMEDGSYKLADLEGEA